MSVEAAVVPRDPAALSRLALTAFLILLLWPGFSLTEFEPAVLFDPRNRETMGKFLGTFIPLAYSGDFLRLVAKATCETLAIATAGMALAFVIAVPFSLVVTRSLSISRIGPGPGLWSGRCLRIPVRLALTIFRSVPEIVWALLFVRAVGLGATAGVFAIGITYGGMLGKVYSEIFESGDTRPTVALLESGAGHVAAFVYGMLPVALPELISYTVYRWECAVRASVIMGFVGAGGLGMQMELSMRMLNGGEVATMLVIFLLLVVLADAISVALRRVIE